MGKRRVCGILLLVVLLWRGLNSMWVIATRPLTVRMSDVFESTEVRVSRTLRRETVGQTVKTTDLRVQLLRDNVPGDAKIYFLNEFTGPESISEVIGFLKYPGFIYPLYIQPIQSLPLPPSANRPPLRDKPTFVLDVRLDRSEPLGAGFTRVAEAADAVLWQKDEPK